MPPDAPELAEFGGRLMFLTLDKLFSVWLETTDMDRTRKAINVLLPGQHPPTQLLALAKALHMP